MESFELEELLKEHGYDKLDAIILGEIHRLDKYIEGKRDELNNVPDRHGNKGLRDWLKKSIRGLEYKLRQLRKYRNGIDGIMRYCVESDKNTVETVKRATQSLDKAEKTIIRLKTLMRLQGVEPPDGMMPSFEAIEYGVTLHQKGLRVTGTDYYHSLEQSYIDHCTNKELRKTLEAIQDKMSGMYVPGDLQEKFIETVKEVLGTH